MIKVQLCNWRRDGLIDLLKSMSRFTWIVPTYPFSFLCSFSADLLNKIYDFICPITKFNFFFIYDKLISSKYNYL